MLQRYMFILILTALFAGWLPSVAHAQDGPGGVGNADGSAGQPLNGVWLQADRDAFNNTGCTNEATDGDAVQCWVSQSEYQQGGNPVETDVMSGADAPTLIGNRSSMGGRPVLEFGIFANAGVLLPDLDPVNSQGPYESHEFYVAFETGSDISQRQMVYEEGGLVNGLNLYIEGGNLIAYAWGENDGWTPISVQMPISANAAYVVGVVFNGAATDQLSLFVNDAQTPVGTDSDPSVNVLPEHIGDIGIGNVADNTEILGANDITSNGSLPFDGVIGDFAHFETSTNDARRRLVMSAMAAKYDIPLTGQLYAYPGFANRVAGTGTDLDGSTHFTAESEGLTLETSSAGTDAFTLAGHNGLAADFTAETEVSGIGTRYERVWRLDRQGSTTTEVSFDVTGIPLASGQEFRLLVESAAGSGTFGAGSSVVTGTLASGTFTISAFDVTSISAGDYLTLARTEVPGPQNVTYSPDAITEAQTNLPVTSAVPTVTADAAISDFEIDDVTLQDTNGNGLPSVTFGDDGSGSDLEINPETGEITVTASAPVGIYDVDVRLTDEQAKEAVFSAVLTVTVTGELDMAYSIPEQIVNPGDAVTATLPEILTEEGDATYSVVTDNLASFPGLSLNTTTGELAGTPTNTGLARVVLRGVGLGTATGDDTTEVHVAVVGGDARAGVGDDVTQILDLEADTIDLADGDPVDTWADASFYQQSVTASGSGRPTYRVSGIGGQPALEFDGTDDAISVADNPQIDDGGEPYSGRSISIAFRTGADITARQVIYEEGGGTRGINAYVLSGDLYVGMWNLNGDDVDTTPWGPVFFSAGVSDTGEGTVSIAPDTDYIVSVSYNAAAGRFEGFLNGTLIGSLEDPAQIGRFYDHNNAVIGAMRGDSYFHDIEDTGGANGFEFGGRVGSVVMHGVGLSDAQRQIVENVFANTYGISVSPSLLSTPFASNETVGVGQEGTDDAHDPDVSSSRLTVTSPTISAGQYAFLAHDNENLSFALDRSAPDDYRGDGSTTTDDRVGSRLDRAWYIDRTGTPDVDIVADVTGFDARTGQFVLLIDSDPTFTPSATVVEGSITGNEVTFTGVGALLGGEDAYVTIGRTVGTASGIMNLTYSPDPLNAENGTASIVSATPTFDGGDPIPEFALLDVRQDGSSISVPSEFSLDLNTGEFEVDPSTALQGSFEVDIQADNGEGMPAVYTLTVNIFETISELTYTDPSQTMTLGEPVSVTVDRPVSDALPGASYSYSVLRVSAFDAIQSDLSGTGLTLAADGTLTGTLSQAGVVSAEIEVTGAGGAQGTATAFVMVSAVGNDGPGGIGDPLSTILYLDPLALLNLDEGGAIAQWDDRSANAILVDQSTSANQPTYRKTSGLLNDQPVVDFDGSSSFLDIEDTEFINGKDVTLQRSKTVVFQADDVTSRQVIYEEGAGTRGITLAIEGGSLFASAWNFANDERVDGGEDVTTPWEDLSGGDGYVEVSTPVSAAQTYVATLTFDFVDGTLDLMLNGTDEGEISGVGRLYAHGGNIGLGGNPDAYLTNGGVEYTSTDRFDGRIGDVVFHTSSLNDAQRRILQNALAAEYGATVVPADALYAGGSATHDLNVIGIGRASAPQRHVSARRGGLQLDRAGGLDDGDYLLAGHDTRQNSESTTDIATSAGTLESRMLRTWYMSRTEPSTSDLTADVTIDLSEAGVVATGGDAGGYRLIHRAATDPTGSTWTVDGTSATVNGDAITFAGVSVTDGHVYTLATTDRALSPVDELSIAIQGTAGTSPDLRIGPDAGFRFIGPLVSGASAQSLTFEDGSTFLQFPPPQGTIFWTWNETLDDPTQPGTQEGWWEAATASTPLPPGRGALFYVLDDPVYAVDPELRIYFDDALDAVSTDDDILVDNLNLGSQFHFFANSYPVPYDLDGLNTDVDGDADGTADFKAVVQVFDATATTGDNEPTDNAVGFYVTKTSDTAQPATEREIAPGQGFFVERNDVVDDGSPRAEALTFDAAFARSRLLEPPTFIGSQATDGTSGPIGRQLALQLTVRDGSGSVTALDRAASVYFREGARTGEDRYDASKLTPLASSYALLGVQGPDRNNTTRLWAQRSFGLPQQMTEVPLELHVSDVSGTAEISAPVWYQIPDDWSAVLVDTKGTSDPSDDVEYEFEPGGEPYVFDLSETATSGASLETKASADTNADREEPTAAPIPRLERLPSMAEHAKAGGETPGGDVRFYLRVYPASDPLPVEFAAFNARPDGNEVLVSWQTLSETNNDGFGVQYQRLSKGDTTVAESQWQESGFVQGNQTTNKPQSYEFRLTSLDFGPHAIRLRQVDTDGTVAYSKVKRVDVRLTEPFVIGKPYPNPLRLSATLEIAVRDAQDVRAEMYDLLGRRVAVLFDGEMTANRTKKLQVDGSRLASGTYFVRVIGDGFAETRRVTVVR